MRTCGVSEFLGYHYKTLDLQKPSSHRFEEKKETSTAFNSIDLKFRGIALILKMSLLLLEKCYVSYALLPSAGVMESAFRATFDMNTRGSHRCLCLT